MLDSLLVAFVLLIPEAQPVTAESSFQNPPDAWVAGIARTVDENDNVSRVLISYHAQMFTSREGLDAVLEKTQLPSGSYVIPVNHSRFPRLVTQEAVIDTVLRPVVVGFKSRWKESINGN